MANEPHPLGHAALRILLALADGERHGYALMQELRVDGLGAALGPGSLYRNIHQLVAERLITESSGASSDSADERRRYFRLTPAGRRALAAEAGRLSDLVKRAAAKGIVAPVRR
ncbi:MAG TPA: helix-turn-helix transcriptional regulator [Gemmatimonadaceae bacterium]